MRKFSFDNLGGLNLGGEDLFSPFTNFISGADITDFISPLLRSFAAPQSMPLFQEINGTSGDDTLDGTENDDLINGLAGNDIIRGRGGDDIIYGGAGNDALIDGEGANILYGGDGDDSLVTGSDHLTMQGITELYGDDGNDAIAILTSGDYPASAIIDGGAGMDVLRITATDYIFTNDYTGGTFNLLTGETTDDYVGISFTNVETLEFFGGGESDTVIGGDGNDDIHGGNGITYFDFDTQTEEGYFTADFLYGMGGNDILNGSGGHDTLDGGDSDDVLIGGSDFTIFPRDNDTLIGGAGMDVAVYSSANAADYIFTYIASGEYTVEAIGGTGEGTDILTGIEFIRLGGETGTDYAIANLACNVVLTEGDDVYSAANNDVVCALGGDDEIKIYTSYTPLNATVFGGDGTDLLRVSGEDFSQYNETGGEFNFTTGAVGGSYSEIVFSEFETLSFVGGGFTDTVTGGVGNDYLYGGGPVEIFDWDTSTSTFHYTADYLYGMGGDDYLRVSGGYGNILDGGAGNDTLVGGIRPESFYGGSGDDLIFGNGGGDQFDGGDGIDTVVFEGSSLGAEVIETAPNTYEVGSMTFVDVEFIRLGGENGTDYAIDNVPDTSDCTIVLTSGDDTYTVGSNEIVCAQSGDDMVTVTGGFVTIYGGVGNDILTETGIDGYVDLRGDDGDDILTIQAAGSTAIGGDGNDIITLTGDALRGFGGYGNDTITIQPPSVDAVMEAYGGSGYDTDHLIFDTSLLAGTDNKFGGRFSINSDFTNGDYSNIDIRGFESLTMTGGGLSDWIYGGTGDDIIYDGGGYIEAGVLFESDDELYGLNGNDMLFGSGGEDTIDGGRDDDILVGGGDDDTLIGGHGIDIAVYESADINDYIFENRGSGVYAVTAIGGAGEGTDTLTEIETIRLGGMSGTDYDVSALFPMIITLTEGGDYFFGTDNAETVFALGGDDGLNAQGGDDILDGGDGIDFAQYGALNVSELEVIQTGANTYTVSAFNAARNLDDGTDTLTNIELINFGTGSGGYYDIDILATYFTMDTSLTAGDDSYSGSNAAEGIGGLDGNDTIFGLGGDDIIFGGEGDDVINGGAGADILFGWIGIDTLSYEGAASGVIINLRTELAAGGAAGDVFSGFENAIGSDFNDIISGNFESNILTGGAGDDTLNGSRGANLLDGGAGEDVLNGGDGPDRLYGGLGDDTLDGGDGVDIGIYSSSDTNDYIITYMASGEYTVEAIGGTGEGTDTLTNVEYIRLGGIEGTNYEISTLAMGGPIDLTTGDDVYSGSSADDVINALAGDDIIDGGTGNNTLNGDAGDDVLISLGNDVLNGGSGNDIVEMGGNVFDTATTTDGGTGIDTLSFSTLGQLPSGNLFLVVDLNGEAYSVRDGSTVLYVDQFTNFENATGSEFRDLLQGDAGANVLSGLGGDDNLQGRDGDDIIDGGAGADIFNGGVGIDTATYASATVGVTSILGDASLNTGDAAGDSYIDIENIKGSSFDDILGGDANANIIDGGDGRDIASYAYASSAIVFDALGLVTDSGDIVDDTLLNIEGIGGTAFDDRFFGDNDASIFYGGEGADRLFGRNGDDELYGEGGNDIILGGRDNDLIDGGAGNDQLRGNEGDDTLLGGDGNDVLAGGAGADVLNGGAGIDRVEYTYGTNAGVTASLGDASLNTGDAAGDSYVDIENLYGTSFDDMLFGDAGNNRIDGRLGDDLLFGGEGNDYLIGGSGNDVMNGEGGNDLLLGQAGVDIYQFDSSHGADRIVVFTQGEDLIEFTEGVFDFSDLTITQDGAHVNIDTGEGTIIVNNSLVADFASEDFIFASPPSQEPLDLVEQDMSMFVDLDALI